MAGSASPRTHHTPAETWAALPERADGLDHERQFPRPWVGNLRVWNAIPHALVPFRCYMLDVDGVDLRDVAVVAGKYAEPELSGRLVRVAEDFVQRAVQALRNHIGRLERLQVIAFSADIAHAHEVQRRLVQHHRRAEVLTGLWVFAGGGARD